ncbi:MAG: hypothetical protein LBS27_10465 [Bifidobacteriaceae bacterium]|jgi:hypothetical protein|nr:hypothetical protein [Bifidobacteriaceae bacterium]
MTGLPAIRRIDLTLGGGVDLDDVVGRDDVIANWWKALETRSLRVTEPRRFGKSTTLKLMASRPPAGWICLYNTVQDASTVERLIELTLGMIQEHTSFSHKVRQKIRSFGQAVGPKVEVQKWGATFELAADFRKTPFHAFEAALADVHAELEKKDQRLVIVWDEFTDCLKKIRDSDPVAGPHQAAETLSLFRALRERVCGRRIRWILSGSVGLHHVLRSLPNAGSVNDVDTVALGPLEPEPAKWLARCLLLGQGRYDEPRLAALLTKASSGIPFVLEHMVAQISASGVAPATEEEAQRTLTLAADAMDAGEAMVPLLERIRTYYSDDDWKAALIILDELAAKPRKLSGLVERMATKLGREVDEEWVRSITERLVEDRYLMFDRPALRYTWLYGAFRGIWHAKRRLE